MYNKVVLVGNLSRDVELRYIPSGTAIANTAIATNRRFKKQDGTQEEEVMFIDLVFFGRTAEVVNQYLRKGSKALIEGRLKLEQWTDKTGGNRSKHVVHVENMTMLDSKPQNTTQETYQPPEVEVIPKSSHQQRDIPIDIVDDEIPF